MLTRKFVAAFRMDRIDFYCLTKKQKNNETQIAALLLHYNPPNLCGGPPDGPRRQPQQVNECTTVS